MKLINPKTVVSVLSVIKDGAVWAIGYNLVSTLWEKANKKRD